MGRRFQRIQFRKINWMEYRNYKKINKFSVNIETQNKLKGIINYKDITWTKKEFSDLFQIGDVIYVKKLIIIIIL